MDACPNCGGGTMSAGYSTPMGGGQYQPMADCRNCGPVPTDGMDMMSAS